MATQITLAGGDHAQAATTPSPGATGVRFFCPGIAAPKGSTRAFIRGGRAVTTHDNTSTKPWQAGLAYAAQQAGVAPAEGPVAVRLVFWLPRPAGHFGKRGLLPSAPAFPAVKPDLDKLVRSCFDALSGIGYTDDARVVSLETEKRYVCGLQGTPGVSVEIIRLGAEGRRAAA